MGVTFFLFQARTGWWGQRPFLNLKMMRVVCCASVQHCAPSFMGWIVTAPWDGQSE